MQYMSLVNLKMCNEFKNSQVRELLEAAKLFQVIKLLEMNDLSVRWLLYLHSLLSFLQTNIKEKVHIFVINW